MDTNNKINNELDLPQFIKKLQKEDNFIGGLYKVLEIMYLIWILLYLLGIIVGVFFMKDLSVNYLKHTCVLSSLIFIYLFLRKRKKEYQNVDYSQTTYDMLKKTVLRYKYYRKEDTLIIIAVSILFIGLGLDNYRGFWHYQIYAWSCVIVCTILGSIWWYFKLKPLKDKANELIKEIEE